MPELSGPVWVSRFPTSTSTSTLLQSFRTKADAFIRALTTAGANVTISATFRPKERAYLMHWSWNISDGIAAPQSVPAFPGVDINWVHRDAQGGIDIPASQQAARAMVNGYALVHQPALASRHTEGRAIDMNISWSGTLAIKQANQTVKNIATQPRTGMNAELKAVGATYGVMKLVSDPPHWSDDGA